MTLAVDGQSRDIDEFVQPGTYHATIVLTDTKTVQQAPTKICVELTQQQWKDVLALMERGVISIGYPAFVSGAEIMKQVGEQAGLLPKANTGVVEIDLVTGQEAN